MEQGKYTYSGCACIFVILVLLANVGREAAVSFSPPDSYRAGPVFPPDLVIGGDFQCYYYMAMRLRCGLPLYEARNYADPRQAALDQRYMRMLRPLPARLKRWMVRAQPVPWNHPPLAACLFVPFTALSHPWAYRVYLAILAAALAASLYLLGRYTRRAAPYWAMSIALIACSYPLRFQMERGTSEPVVLLLVTAAFVLWDRKESALLAGACIALAGHIKIYPFIFLYYFIVKREWRVCASIAAFSLALAGAGALAPGEGLAAGLAQYGKLYRYVKDVYLHEGTWVFAGNHSTYSFLSYLLEGRHLPPARVLACADAVNLVLVALATAAILAREARDPYSRLLDFSMMIVPMTVIPYAAIDYSLVMLYFVFAACAVSFERLEWNLPRVRALFVLFAAAAALVFLPTLKMPIVEGPTGGYYARLWFLSNKWPVLMLLEVILWRVRAELLRRSAAVAVPAPGGGSAPLPA